MSPAVRAQLIVDCQQAVIRFFAALDAGRMDDVAKAFDGDGIWHRQGKQLQGPSGVAEALASRPAGRVTAHLIQNFIADFDDERTARTSYVVLTYRHDAPDGAKAAAAPMVKPYSIAAYDDRMRFDGSRWLVLERRSRNMFMDQ